MSKRPKTPEEWRAPSGLSGEALALKAGISPNTLAKVEEGRPDVSTRILRRIARALGVGVREYADAL